MSAPYQVFVDDAGDHRLIDCPTLKRAIRVALDLPYRRNRRVQVIGEGAEGGYGDDGSGWWDGLTDQEREQVEAAGVM